VSSYDKYKDELSKLDRASWAEAEDLLLDGDTNGAVEALLVIVPDAARAYAKAVAVHGLDFDDLIGAGNLALMEAVYGWNPGGESLKNWCYKKVARDMGRHVGRELGFSMHTEPELPLGHDDEQVDTTASLEEQVQDKDIREWLTDNLTTAEAEVAHLVYFGGKGVREIARIKGVSGAAVSKIHRRVIKKLHGGVDTLGMSRDIL